MAGAVFRNGFPMEVLGDIRHVAEVGAVPGENELGHKDGWGLVSFRNGSPWYLGRSHRPVFMDPSFDSALREVARLVPPNILIAHVRAASAGVASMENTHPFIVNGFVFGHNGTLTDYHPRTSMKPKGGTDSELLALVLADRFEEKGDLRLAIETLVRDDIANHDFSAAVLLISDGKRLFGYRDYSDESKADYYNLNIAKGENEVVLFQETGLDFGRDVSQVKKGELVSIDLDLRVSREMLH